MNKEQLARYMGPAAAAAGAVLLVIALLRNPGARESTLLRPPEEKPRLEVSMFQVNGLVENAIKENPALKAEEESVREEMQEGIVEQEVLVREALAQNLAARDTIVRNRLAELMVMSIYQQADAQLTSQAVQDYYEKNKDKYLRPARRQVIQLLVPVTNRVSSEEARAQLEQKYQRLTAAGKGDNDEKADLPEPRWFTLSELRMKYGPTFAEFIFHMPLGQWSEPLQSSSGWHRILVLDQSPEQPRPFAEAEKEATEDLRRELRRQVYEQELQRMKEKYEIVIVE